MKENHYNFATFNSVADTKTSKIQMGPNTLNVGKLIIYFFLFLRISYLILIDQNENIICTVDDLRGDLLGP